ncbi:hypothetical protein [uncultured Sphingomonas sp.]|uniref:hypothetical protein n=1 Tax=uncultured Sphingomonas sp. TaxID=158754 RepID=UPI00261A349A|nr:hypothetical protein [uncultured Sphingomonas sp.]
MAPAWVSRWFRGAAIYGLVVLLPQYFQTPPAGAEAFAYGFIGTASAFQLAFWIIGGDPVRYRALMPVAVVEKLVFAAPVAILCAQGRAPALLLPFGLIDLLLGIGFLLAFRATPRS